MITRGVILDIAGYKGVDHLEGGTVVTAADLEGTAKKQQLSIQQGDAVLMHTGWSRHFIVDNQKYVRAEPGEGRKAHGG